MDPVEPVSVEVVQQVAEYFSVLSEPMRLRILNLLREGEKWGINLSRDRLTVPGIGLL